MANKLERIFQSELIKELEQRLPGCIVMKLDSSYIQGIPDLLVLYKDRWGVLEVKKDRTSSKRPNQSYYIDTMNKMSFARFIDQDNKEEVLHEICKSLQS